MGFGRGCSHRTMQVVVLVVLLLLVVVLCTSSVISSSSSSSIPSRPIFWFWRWICGLLAVVLVLWGLQPPCR